jgi:hypothetical protein
VRGWSPKLASGSAQLPLFVTIQTLLRGTGVIYFIAFGSFGAQAIGLIGSRGILPYRTFLQAARGAWGASAYWQIPSLLWLWPTDGMLTVCWIAGLALAAAAVAGFYQRLALAGCLVLWLSICAVGQDFLSFQWDILLSEAGFLAIFADDSRVRIWLFRWLLFRLMFFSGAVKLLSGDPTWRNLTALHYQYETQPLPTPVAWYMYQLPMWFQKASTLFTFFAELIVPFWYFAPRPVRYVGGLVTIALQLMILTTGNYTFFNWLTILLTIPLFLEARMVQRTVLHRVVTVALATFIGITSGLLCLQLFNFPVPPGGGAVLHAMAPLRIVNSYGLFAVMTTERPEIVVEGSADGVNWRAYEFKYKADDVNRAPPIVAPHQPRLDWQMWFAALGDYRENRWFVNFVVRLLQGEPAVLRLLEYNPFPKTPPKFVRARVYQYHFTHFGERAWWRREEKGEYLPTVSLQ